MGARRVILGHFQIFNDRGVKKKCKKMYFNELYINEQDTKNVPESENKGFCDLTTSQGLPITVIFSYQL